MKTDTENEGNIEATGTARLEESGTASPGAVSPSEGSPSSSSSCGIPGAFAGTLSGACLDLDAIWLSDARPGLFARVVRPEHPWAALVMVHGSMVHSEYYLPIALALAGHGIGVVLPDLRGHGRSEGRRGHADRTLDHISDAIRVLGRTCALFPDLPIAVGGESYGALIAYLAAADHPHDAPIAALILSAPAFVLRTQPEPHLLAWLRRMARLVPGAYLPVRLTLAGVSSRPDVETLSERDPLINHQYTLGFYIGLLEAQGRARRVAKRTAIPPTLALLGGRDRVTDNRETEKLLANLPHACSIVYPNDLHGVLAEAPARTAADIAAFLGAVVSPRGSSTIRDRVTEAP